MNQINPIALLIVAICGVIGALAGQTLVGVLVGLLIVLFGTVSEISDRKKKNKFPRVRR